VSTPPIVMRMAGDRLVPVTVTTVPIPPLLGLKAVTVGGGRANVCWLLTVPPGVVTVIGPVVAPAGTLVMISEATSVVTVAGVPLKVTEVAPVRPEPRMVTEVPILPDAGVMLLMVGGGAMVKI
jgi:hypothetical protein